MGILMAASAIQGNSQTYTLPVANSSVQVNLTSGLSDWIVGGADQLGGQSFYYSLGTTEAPISQLGTPSAPMFTGASFGGVVLDTNLTVTYANSTLSLTTGYTLQALGNGATLTTAITIQNLSSVAQTLKFYQLSDFTLGGLTSGQTLQFAGTTFPFSVTQTGGGYLLNGSLSGTGLGTSVTVDEMAGNGNLGLGNGNVDPNFNNTLTASGSVDYGYEFIVTLGANSGIGITEIQTVPEPSTVTLVCSALGLCLLRLRRFAKQS
jgi:hypothetical protein